MVGVAVKPSQSPAMTLEPRDQVLLVLIPSSTDAGSISLTTQPEGVSASVLSVGPIETGGTRTVDVVVPEARAGAVAALAATSRLAIVFVSRG